MQVCTLLQTDNHANTLPLSFLQAGCPSCRPTNSIKALKALSAAQEKITRQRVKLITDKRTCQCFTAVFSSLTTNCDKHRYKHDALAMQ